jgi:V-type H+-transporting ATPase subunit E
MNDIEASSILKSMVQFIRSHGDERVATIMKQADDEFTVQKESYIAEEKERIAAEIKDRLRKDEINLKIEKSKKENAQRIDNMRETNVLIQKLYKEAKVKIVQNQKTQASAYKNMIKDLILQV